MKKVYVIFALIDVEFILRGDESDISDKDVMLVEIYSCDSEKEAEDELEKRAKKGELYYNEFFIQKVYRA